MLFAAVPEWGAQALRGIPRLCASSEAVSREFSVKEPAGPTEQGVFRQKHRYNWGIESSVAIGHLWDPSPVFPPEAKGQYQ